MQIQVRFFTILREVTGKKEEYLVFPNEEKTTVTSALRKLSQAYGKPFDEYVYRPETGEVKSFLQFLINGNSTSTLNGLETELKDGDVLAIVPPVGGG